MRVVDPRLLHRARGVRTLLGADVALGLATATLILIQATLLARIVTRAFDGAGIDAVASDLALLVLAFAGRGALTWGFEVAGRRAAASVLSELRLALAEQRLRTQPTALDDANAGELAAAAIPGVEALESYFARYLPQIALACLVPIAVLAWVAPLDPGSAAIMAATLPLVPVFMWLVGRYTERRTQARWDELSRLSTQFLDALRGLPTLRAFNRGRAESKHIAHVGERYRDATMATLRASFLSGTVLELAATLGVALVAVTVGVRLVEGGLGLQAGLTVLVLAPELYVPLRRLGAEYHASTDGLAASVRLLDLLDAPAAVGAGGPRTAPSPAVATVRVERACFAYPGRATPVLANVDLELHPGETVALVGASGAGKSTVASLLMRLLEPTDGRVSVGGIDLAECDADAWRREIAWVPQHPSLLRGSVASNIRLGDPDACRERVRRASALAGADPFIDALPAGYDTIVGNGARTLSAGERRRIGLARALLRDAPLMILDEPTADLDPRSAAVVAEAVAGACAGRTVLLIAHTPELAGLADRTVRLGADATLAHPALEAA